MSSLDKKTKTNSAQQQTSTSELTDWSKQEKATRESNILSDIEAFKNTARPTAFSGPTVAGLTADEIKARDMARTMAPRSDVQYRTFADFDPETYYNPFESEVVDATGAYFDEDLAKKTSAQQAAATMSGSYGGSRHGVADAELNRTSLMDKTKMMADLRYSGYEGAKDQFNRDSDNLYGADVRNSDAAYGDTLKQIDMLSSLGASEREIEQAKMLAEKAQYDEGAADEWRRFNLELQTKLGFYQSTPMLTTNNSSGTSSSTSKTSDPIGTISSLASGAGGLFTGLDNVFKF